jgi:UDP:flavonoid glycosyltransferase YjiC (YdhE family)
MIKKKKIIFFAHAVTMAHFTRPLKWIECLDKDLYEIYLASNPLFEKFLKIPGVKFLPMNCIESKEFLKRVESCSTIYDVKTFEEHIQEDLNIIEEISPDLVIGDYRLSLSVSSRLKKVKYINISNAYWSPDAKLGFPLPESPFIRAIGEPIAKFIPLFFIRLIVRFNLFTIVNEINKALEQVNLKFSDYRQVISDGDVTVYCDSPLMVPLKKQKKSEHFVGPVIWSSSAQLPQWWSQLDAQKPRIFVSLGSSGDSSLLPMIIQTLSKLDVNVIVALAGKNMTLPTYDNVFVSDLFPLEDVCKDASLVICNGGSPMCHGALTYGVPVLGIINNSDQLLNMAYIEKLGAGCMLRSWNLTPKTLLASVLKISKGNKYHLAAKNMGTEFSSLDVEKRLREIVAENI